MEVPSNWSYHKAEGELIDGYAAEIRTSRNDTIHLIYSFATDDLSHDGRDHVVLPEHLKAEMIAEGEDLSRYVFVPTENDVVPMREKLTTQQFEQTILNGKQAKMVLPKQIGKGVTGVHITAIRFVHEQNTYEFTLYGRDLPKKTHKALLQVFKSIRFKE